MRKEWEERERYGRGKRKRRREEVSFADADSDFGEWVLGISFGKIVVDFTSTILQEDCICHAN